LKTRADGACGIHATFGVCDPFRGEIAIRVPEVLYNVYALSHSLTFVDQYEDSIAVL
jgi:hypothetical protein